MLTSLLKLGPKMTSRGVNATKRPFRLVKWLNYSLERSSNSITSTYTSPWLMIPWQQFDLVRVNRSLKYAFQWSRISKLLIVWRQKCNRSQQAKSHLTGKFSCWWCKTWLRTLFLKRKKAALSRRTKTNVPNKSSRRILKSSLCKCKPIQS